MADGRGNIYINGAGFNPVAGEESRPGAVIADNSTLIVADSYRHHLVAFDIGEDGGLSGRRVWADLGEGTPDGICADSQDAVWYADVPGRRCARVAAGGTAVHHGSRVAGHDRNPDGDTRQRPGPRRRNRRAGRRLALTTIGSWRSLGN